MKLQLIERLTIRNEKLTSKASALYQRLKRRDKKLAKIKKETLEANEKCTASIKNAKLRNHILQRENIKLEHKVEKLEKELEFHYKENGLLKFLKIKE